MKKNLKITSLALVLVLVLAMLAGCGAAKDTDPASSAYVTITNQAELAAAKDGSLMAAVAIEIPADGSTVGDVIKLAHEKYFTDGASGFATTTTEWGDSITKLWGVENGGSYGYYVNGAMSYGLTDPVKAGDRVDIMIYKDAATFSDVYTYVDAKANGTSVTATVEALGFDENWNPKMAALAGAKIYYTDGKKLTDTGAVTGEDGTATFTLKAGTYRIVSIAQDGLYSVSAQKIVVSK